MKILEETKNLLRIRGYSPKTRKSYLFYISEYLEFSKRHKIKNKNEAIERFLLKKVKRGNSGQTINLALNAIKFLYREVLKDTDKINFKCSKKSKKSDPHSAGCLCAYSAFC